MANLRNRYIACRETHEPNEKFGDQPGHHFHVLMDMGLQQGGRAPKITGVRAFDLPRIGAVEGQKKTYHPNMAGAKSVKKSWDYVNKREKKTDVVFHDIDRCNELTDPAAKKARGSAKHDIWHTISDQKTREEAEAAIERLAPNDYWLRGQGIDYRLNQRFPIQEVDDWKPEWPKHKHRPWRKVRPIEQWLDMYLWHEHRGRKIGLWIVGKTGCDKSHFLRRLGRHIWLKGGMNAKTIHSNVDFILVDDIDISNFREFYNPMIQGSEFNFTGKYCAWKKFDAGKMYGKNGIPCIWTSNYNPFFENNAGIDVEWLRENIILVDTGSTRLTLDKGEPDIIYELECSIPRSFEVAYQDFRDERKLQALRVVFDWRGGSASHKEGGTELREEISLLS